MRPILVALFVVALTSSVRCATVYVAANGVDGTGCGTKASPCRSISQGTNVIAAAGDTVVVGPGRYGDLDYSGTLGDSPGEEPGAFGCMLVIGQAVTLTSTNGAAATVIDARTVGVGCNVGIIADGTIFGKPGKGFTVTHTNQVGIGVQLATSSVTVSGDQIVGDASIQPASVGITTPNTANTAVITGNQVLLWGEGIRVPADGPKILKNEISQNNIGLEVNAAAVITGNVVTGGRSTAVVFIGANGGTVSGNAILGNAGALFVSAPFSGTIEKNNVFGNGSCAFENGSSAYAGQPGLIATNNYWGAATGPGADPADAECDANGGSTTTSPFATKPFSVKATIKP